MRTFHRPLAAALVLAASSCVTVPTAPPVVGPTYEQKLSWLLRLEDQRVLHDPMPPPAPVVPPTGRKQKAAPPAPPPAVPDMVAMLKDSDARVRRRAALAVGRVRLVEGVAPLGALLASDPESEVRQMAAFGLGLSGHAEGSAALRAALSDPSPIVRGRAAEALGLINDTASAPEVAEMVAGYVKAGTLSKLAPEESSYSPAPEVEAARLGIYALVRLKAYDALASVVLDTSGAPVTRWWPVAFALGRIHDPRATPALRQLVSGEGIYTRGFAARGLGAAKDREAVDLLKPLASAVGQQPGPGVEAVRALGEIGDPRALPILIDLLKMRGVHPGIRADAVASIGKLHVAASVDVLLDLLSDPAPVVRAQAIAALATTDRPRFLETLSGLDSDRHWTVRAALATTLGRMPVEISAPLLEPMAADQDQRVLPAVIEALAAIKAPRAAAIAIGKLKADDPVVRAAAARAIGALKPSGAVDLLKQAAEYANRDSLYVARAAALTALVEFGKAAAEPSLTAALTDKDWAVRLKAAELLHQLDPGRNDEAAIRPAPARFDQAVYGSPDVITPKVSTELYIDTDKGTIQVALAVLDAPLTVRTITDLARSGYFGGVAIHRVVPDFVVQDGDPRGDGEGGPGFTIRDELNERPYLRGAVGMALDWADTGGSQFFIALTPQPHLDAKYTVFGQVISGMDVVDKLAQGDLIRGVRVWDGTAAPAPLPPIVKP